MPTEDQPKSQDQLKTMSWTDLESLRNYVLFNLEEAVANKYTSRLITTKGENMATILYWTQRYEKLCAVMNERMNQLLGKASEK